MIIFINHIVSKKLSTQVERNIAPQLDTCDRQAEMQAKAWLLSTNCLADSNHKQESAAQQLEQTVVRSGWKTTIKASTSLHALQHGLAIAAPFFGVFAIVPFVEIRAADGVMHKPHIFRRRIVTHQMIPAMGNLANQVIIF